MFLFLKQHEILKIFTTNLGMKNVIAFTIAIKKLRPIFMRCQEKGTWQERLMWRYQYEL